MKKSIRLGLLMSAAPVLALSSGAVVAQTTPGDQSGTPTSAGTGQSAATSTQAPASPQGSPVGTARPASAAVTPTSPSGASSGAGAPPRGGDTSGDIIVTARRVEERLQDVPISITVFNQQQLSNRNVVTAGDLGTYTPSLQTDSFFGSQNTAFSIRGFVQDFGTQPSVGVYFADVVSPRAATTNIPAGDGAGPGAFFDLQNVQVLKGPQGTLFGRNTTGGAVLLVPQKPTSRFEGYVEGSYGNYDMKRIQGVINVPLGDNARFRIGADHEDRDGYLKNTTGIGPSRFNDLGYTAVRASMVLDLTPDLENYTIVSWNHSSTSGDLQKLYYCDPAKQIGVASCAALDRQNAANKGFYGVSNPLASPTVKQTTWQIINTTTWRAGDNLTLKNIASYAQLTQSYSSGIFGINLDAYDIAVSALPAAAALYRRGTYVKFTDVLQAPGARSANQSTFTEEVQLQGSGLGDKLDYQTGLYTELSDPLGRAGSNSEGFLDCPDVSAPVCRNALQIGSVNRNYTQTRFRNYGTYLQASYKLTDQFKITGGIRYTWDRVRSVSQQQLFFFPFVFSAPLGQTATPSNRRGCQVPELTPPTCDVTYRTRSQKPTWLIDLDYKPTEDILAYAKYARGYRAGGITANVPPEYATFEPEKVDSYEVGLKTTLRGALRGTFNLAGFYNDFSNQQLRVTFSPKPGQSVPVVSGIANAGKSRIWGIEADTSVTPFEGFTLDASYAYLNTKVRRVVPVTLSAISLYNVASASAAGDPLAFSPKHKATVTASYTLPLDPGVGKVTPSLTYVYVDRFATGFGVRDADGGIADLGYVKHRSLLNANLNWNSVMGSKFDISAFATNLTNKKYFTYVSGLIASVGLDTATLGEPRMYGGRLRYRF